MEWVKDPKNQPIVAAIAIVVIIGVGIFYYFNFIKAPSAPAAPPPEATATATDGSVPQPVGTPTSDPAAQTPAPAPGAPPTDPSTAGAPAATTAAAAPAAAGTQVAAVTPMETWRSDPFLPIGHKARKVVKVTPPIRDFPFVTLPGVHISKTVKREKPEIQQPPRRMAGILLNDRVFAIIESNGGSEVVQPGDYLKDRLAMVQRIEPDRVVLKTVDEKPRYITVRMAESAHQNTPVSSVGPSNMPGPIPMPGRPRGGAVAPGLGEAPP